MRYDLSKSRLNLRDEAALLFAEGIVDTIREPILVLDHNLRVISLTILFMSIFMLTLMKPLVI